jgi:hypothetical protein
MHLGSSKQTGPGLLPMVMLDGFPSYALGSRQYSGISFNTGHSSGCTRNFSACHLRNLSDIRDRPVLASMLAHWVCSMAAVHTFGAILDKVVCRAGDCCFVFLKHLSSGCELCHTAVKVVSQHNDTTARTECFAYCSQ